jgi:2-phospho-L-lactate guanylyltransferase
LTTVTPFTRSGDLAGADYRGGCEDLVVTSPGYALLIPVKDGRAAKSRLGVGDDVERAQLMTAFARDAISAATGLEGIDVHVVGDEVALHELVLGLAVSVLPDEGDGDLNQALSRAALRVAAPGRGIAVLLADLPCLRSADLGSAFAAGTDRRYVADAAGTGTTLLISPPGTDLDPRFGAGSALAHAASGARPLTEALESLRLDVDTTDDLEAALRFGVGVNTARVASGRL